MRKFKINWAYKYSCNIFVIIEKINEREYRIKNIKGDNKATILSNSHWIETCEKLYPYTKISLILYG